MNSRRCQAEDPNFAPRLYLILEDRESGGLLPELGAALRSVPVAAVLLRGGEPGPDGSWQGSAQTASLIQDCGAALLLEDHPNLVAETGADGCHITRQDALAPALRALHPEFIVGTGGLRTRHDAMVAGEAGANYVMFGEPDHAGQHPAAAAVLERVAWWTELFEAPCVGYAQDMDAAEALARAGAEFVAVGSWVWTDPRGAIPVLADVWARLQRVEFAS